MTRALFTPAIALVVAIMGVAAVIFGGMAALLYLEGYHPGTTPLLHKTVTVATIVEGAPLERNPGFIDTNGDGYIMAGFFGVRVGHTYDISYFCSAYDNTRKVAAADDITPRPIVPAPTPLPTNFICQQKSNGECL